MSTITSVSLAVAEPQVLADFYRDVLGMEQVSSSSRILGYGGRGATLQLAEASVFGAYEHHVHDRYWKIAITLPDLDVAYRQLTMRGIDVTEPRQFREIARMCHLADPEGHVIELLQHTFADKAKRTIGDPERALGGGAQLGLITLRTADIEAEMVRCRDELGMDYLSRQAVTDLGFDLYFFGFADERPPSDEVDAVVNREWLWQRPYTVLEFQHRLDVHEVRRRRDGELGAAKVLLDTSDGPVVFQ